ncbi:uncharacterized protein LOC143536168 [Bidens hawaiensis]|uniref:uncharacterized protein LOC143536168 n=1 Tax=Bidens hawaiensis TaxID=980011 RepID=UPI00404B3A07
MFPSLFALEKHKAVLVKDCYCSVNNETRWLWRWKVEPKSRELKAQVMRCTEVLSSVIMYTCPDTWLWKEGSGNEYIFTVKSLRWELDNVTYPVVETNFWLNLVPIKVNCFIWRLLLDRISTKKALLVRGINLGDDICALCGLFSESSEHLMLHCRVAKRIWSIIHSWVKVPSLPDFDSVKELLDYPMKLKRKKDECMIIQAIYMVTCWLIWKTRNGKTFKNIPILVDKVAMDIKAASFLWVVNRSRRSSVDWEDWYMFNFVNFPM